MSAVAKLLAQKEQLLARLEADPGPNETAEIQALLAKIETALKLLGSQDSAAARPTSSARQGTPKLSERHPAGDDGPSSGG